MTDPTFKDRAGLEADDIIERLRAKLIEFVDNPALVAFIGVKEADTIYCSARTIDPFARIAALDAELTRLRAENEALRIAMEAMAELNAKLVNHIKENRSRSYAFIASLGETK